jgi:hypothetical protein
MLALAANENDRAVLLYGLSGRETSGSEFEYTTQMAREIFEINKTAIEREMGNVTVLEAKPSPIASVFLAIEAMKDDKAVELNPLAQLGINPMSISKLTIYDGPDDIARYSKYANDPIKKEKYFGDMLETGKIKFDSGPGESRGYAGMLDVVKKWAKKDMSNVDLQQIRGTAIRKMVASGAGLEEFKDVIPPIYNDEEASRIFEIMKTGVKNKMQSNVSETLRATIRAMIMG